jgi:hypothetical protein
MTYITRLKKYPISGAMLYLGVGLLNDPDFDFSDGELLKIEIEYDKLVISKPKWYELLDWTTFEESSIEQLPEEAKEYAKSMTVCGEQRK